LETSRLDQGATVVLGSGSCAPSGRTERTRAVQLGHPTGCDRDGGTRAGVRPPYVVVARGKRRKGGGGNAAPVDPALPDADVGAPGVRTAWADLDLTAEHPHRDVDDERPHVVPDVEHHAPGRILRRHLSLTRRCLVLAVFCSHVPRARARSAGSGPPAMCPTIYDGVWNPSLGCPR